ncbi:MAG TPA: serpin family protein, partial [Casimicrobiaceae bacterium]
MPRILALLAAAALSLGAAVVASHARAQQAPTIPPLKGEVGEQSEPGGVGRPASTARLDPAELNRAQSTLGFRLIAAMARQPDGDGNLMVSPASLAAVMALLDLGASADMRAGVYKVLGFEEGGPEISADRLAALRATVKLMQSDAEGALTSASSIVFDPAAAPSAQIAAQLADSGAQVTVEDLNDAATISRINEWVAARTRGLIPSIIEQAPREPGLVALNALHFKDRWKNAFDDSLTRPAAFQGLAGALGDVPMMQSEGSLRLREEGAFVAVELPYASDRFRLVVITTKARPASAAEFEEVADWLSGEGFESRPGEVSMPRFRLTGSADLLATLDTLGLKPARLSPGALAGLSPAGMAIAQVLQRTEIRVDEAGTEAAAATAVTTTRAIATDFAKVVIDK